MKKLKPTETLTEQAYRVIKQAIINNEFEPDEVLAEEHLAEDLGISRTPIKAALKQLEFDGLVDLKTGRKARVSKISLNDLNDIQVLRESLETLATRLAAKKVEEQQLVKLEGICAQQRQAIVEDDYSKFIELDNDFHFEIADISGNEQLKKYIVNLSHQVQRFLILSDTLQGSAAGAVDEHLQIIEALRNKNPIKAEEQMLLHVQNVTKRILAQ
ncbi:GntR family transcriptional regulator [Alkalibacillus haloalkaliphilus]|uniref:GntR family transcriptional regulator n=1 Tax=Alkalibacillus haloalkaliphilus TaxID=94136 RepID=UPI002936B43D|nr:GntR family transcriptional regulator [Alkalibacillus haloalkaliphilus]MDV2582172.1 GntR family transcriptional regulator [Alkalibacillus haloalkaliphilus]